jgi:ubiquitin carboxyl-terminal hydrolase 7
LKKEQEEKELKRKEKAEAHLYTIIKVARDENLHEQIGKNIFFDLVDHDKVRSFRIQKQTSFSLFKVLSDSLYFLSFLSFTSLLLFIT